MSYNADHLVTVGQLKTATKKSATKRGTVTLSTAGWNGSTMQQSVTVTGILADESKQLIQAVPASASRSTYNDCGVSCVAQAANSLTFSCQQIPSAALTVYVLVDEVTDLS